MIEIMKETVSFQTIEDFLPEINSETFRAGAEAALKHTQETERETAFKVYYGSPPGAYYDGTIKVGSKEGVSRGGSAFWNMAQILGKFSWKLSESEIDTLNRTTEVNGIPCKLTFSVPDKKKCPEYRPRNIRELLDVDVRPALILFHTHPQDDRGKDVCCPSFGDLRLLHWYKTIPSKHNPFVVEKRPLEYNPLFVIFGVIRDISMTEVPAIVYQEKENAWAGGISKASKLENASEGMHRDFQGTASHQLALDNYQWLRGTYTIGKGFAFGSQ